VDQQDGNFTPITLAERCHGYCQKASKVSLERPVRDGRP
jgi:hypothetical protein